jgi:hypothetical protein
MPQCIWRAPYIITRCNFSCMPESGERGVGGGGAYFTKEHSKIHVRQSMTMVVVLSRLFRMRNFISVYLEPYSTIVDSIGYTRGISYLFTDEHFVMKPNARTH